MWVAHMDVGMAAAMLEVVEVETESWNGYGEMRKMTVPERSQNMDSCFAERNSAGLASVVVVVRLNLVQVLLVLRVVQHRRSC